MEHQSNDLINLKATELRLGLPGSDDETISSLRSNKRTSSEITATDESRSSNSLSKVISNMNNAHQSEECAPPPAKAQVVGWPPVRTYRKNSFNLKKSTEVETKETTGMYVKVSMDGAPYLRKIDVKIYKGYSELLKTLESMFKFSIGEYMEREGYKGSEFVPTYEDKDGDWMLVGDVPWDMFMTTCKRLRIMKGSEARGLGCGV